jgi:hypothetical protein
LDVNKIIAEFETHLKEIEKEFDELKAYEPDHNMGKWGRKVRMDNLAKYKTDLEKEIRIKKSLAALKEKLAELKTINKK